MYHGVEPQEGDATLELVPAIGLAVFERQIRHLRRRYEVVPAEQLLRAAVARRRGQRLPVAITFDDDLSSHSRFALPVLARERTSATFFLTGSSLAGAYSFWWERLARGVRRSAPEVARAVTGAPDATVEEMGVRLTALQGPERDAVEDRLAQLAGPDPPDAGLRASDIRVLADAGMDVGFHTRRHESLPALADEALERALRDGRDELEAVVGSPLRLVCYPYGHEDARVAEAARRAGFEAGFTTRRGAATGADDPLLLPRLGPSHRSAGAFALQLVVTLLRGRG
jgi:peptidoglycan/xylan/chitin deacetylase (PgdA/CDA1 family)